MFSFSLSLVFLATFLLHATADRNPCHLNKTQNGLGVTCEKVRLPNKLCTACKLKPPGPGGHFVNCRSIYDLDSKACRYQLNQYAKFNRHCDPVRSRQLKGISNPLNKQGLDYFIYSICEECCDCVPIGAHISQFRMRRKTGKLINVNRGNCPAHAVYDICKVWPKVRFVSRGKMKNEFSRPMICEELRKWFNSPASTNWLGRSFVPINDNIKHFLERFSYAARCTNRGTWERCQRLEAAQQRV